MVLSEDIETINLNHLIAHILSIGVLIKTLKLNPAIGAIQLFKRLLCTARGEKDDSSKIAHYI